MRGLIRRAVILVCISFFLLSSGKIVQAKQQPTEGKTQRLLQQVAEKTKGLKSYRAKSTTRMEIMKQLMVTEGKLVCKLPNKTRMEMELPVAGGVKMKQLIVCDGKVLWTYIPQMKVVYKVDKEKV